MKIFKLIAVIVALGTISPAIAQSKFSTRSGTLTFEASVPSFEEVKATNEEVSAILNPETGEFATLALVKAFRFKVALMEEHFNENYIESSEYPKTTFKGVIADFAIASLNETPTKYNVRGVLQLHGVDKEIATSVLLSIKDGKVILETQFELSPKDFDIKIPNIVSSKIAETVIVSGNYSLSN